MKAESQEQIFSQFLWVRPHPDKENLVSMYGLAIGDGWCDLLKNLFSDIEDLYRTKGLELNLEVVQVKEKFGALVVYFHDCLDEVLDLKQKYEQLSQNVCYDCGEVGTHRRLSGWWVTICNPCADSRIADLKRRLGRD
jgi:hypothetical protein